MGSVEQAQFSTVDRGLDSPPKIPFALSVGVTGHRLEALPPDALPKLRAQIRSVLELVKEMARAVQEAEADCFAPQPARFLFVSPLAEGADQLAAEIALDLGFELHAVLPFARGEYRATLHDDASRSCFDALLAKSKCVLELPGHEDRALEAYVMTGRSTVAHCDLLLALWDGLPPRGRGGTGEVVELAVANGTPVVHLPIADEEAPRLLWSAFDPTVVTKRVERTAERPFDRQHLEAVLGALIAPPSDPQERQFLNSFAKEKVRRIRARIEYPMLLAAAGVKKFNARNMRESHCAAMIDDEWTNYRQGCTAPHKIDPSLDLLQTYYSWTDRLATRFAQTYRSGHIFNFVLGGLAVCMGLSAGMFPGALLELAIAEGFITIGVITNTRIGVKNEWHRRWLDYRQLAERLRPMRSLKLLGVAAPDPPGSITNPVPRRWIDWYALGVWRAMGCPSGAIDAQGATKLGQAVAEHELAPQIAYHRRHAGQIDLLDHRLEKVASLLFYATLTVSIIVVTGLAIAPEWVNRYSAPFTLVSAGFPALGTAVFGIRFQGDFGGSAVRSLATANALEAIEEELAAGVDLSRAADLAEQAARTMLGDLDEWRLVNQQQELDLT